MSEVTYDSVDSKLKGFEESVAAGDEEDALNAAGQQYAGIVRTEAGVVAGVLSPKGQASLAQDAVQMRVFNEAIDEHASDNNESEASDDNLDDDRDRGKTLRALCTGLLALGGLSVVTGVVVGGYFGIVALTKSKKSAELNNKENTDAPTPNDQSVSVAHNTATSITLTASDSQARAITYAYNQPSHGTVSGTAPDVIYTPNSGFEGDDSFTFTASAGGSASDPAKIKLSVAKKPAITPPPVVLPSANQQTLTTEVNAAVDVTLTGVSPSGTALSFQVTTQPAHGTLAGTAPALKYTPNKDFEGADEFEFTATASNAVSKPAKIIVNVREATDNSGETSKWFKAINDPIGTDKELAEANQKLRGLNEEQFWNVYWKAVAEMGASVTMQARLAKHVAALQPISRFYGADAQTRVDRKEELWRAAQSVAAQMLVGYDAVKKTALRASFKTGYDSIRDLQFTTGGTADVPRRLKLWALGYALDQVAIKQGRTVSAEYNPYISPSNELTDPIRLEKVLKPLNGKVNVFLRPSSIDIEKVRWKLDGNKTAVAVPRQLYFAFVLDTTTLTKGQHSLDMTVEFQKSTGKAKVTKSIAFDVDNT